MVNRFNDTTIKAVLVILLVVLILYMVVSFQGTGTQSIYNTQKVEKVLAGSQQTYTLYLKTVDPKQYETALHYREQFGRWRLESANGTVLSPGKDTQISMGQYYQDVTIEIPYEQEVWLVAEIIEYQHSAADPDGPWLKDEGTIRVSQKLKIEVQACIEHADCMIDMCLGQFGYCSEGLCEVKGECKECTSGTECSTFEEANGGKTYTCSYSQCFEEKPVSALDQLERAFSQPITEPNPVKKGEAPQAKEVPPLLGFGILILIAGLLYMMSKKKGRRR